MINVIIGTNVTRTTVIVTPDTIIKDILSANDVDYSTKQVHLDGVLLDVEGMNKSLEDFGITDKCMLIAATKTSNAA